MTVERLANLCGCGVAVGEFATGCCHAYAHNWKAAGMWLFYSLAAGLLAFMR